MIVLRLFERIFPEPWSARCNASYQVSQTTMDRKHVGMQAAFDQVFLGAVKRHLKIGAAVVIPAWHQNQAFRDRRGLVGVIVLQGQRSAGEYLGFASVQGDCQDGFAGLLRPFKAAQYLISAFNDLLVPSCELSKIISLAMLSFT